jgi:hypothetical protein
VEGLGDGMSATPRGKSGLMIAVKEHESFSVIHGGERLVVTRERRNRCRFEGPKTFAVRRPGAEERSEAQRREFAGEAGTPPGVGDLLNEAARMLADGDATPAGRIELARRLHGEAGGMCPVCSDQAAWEDGGGRGCPLCRLN